MSGGDVEGDRLADRVFREIARGTDRRPFAHALALEVFAWQRSRCVAIDRIARALGADDPGMTGIEGIRGVPTDAFKTARIACFEPSAERRVFHTSGTTREVRGRHAFADLRLYDAAALASARRWLLPAERYSFVLLAEPEQAAPNSSLSYMLARFAEQWGGNPLLDFLVRDGALDAAAVRARVALARGPVALLGASFAFVHLLDADMAPLPLPPGSVVMPTGGFKGRSREVHPETLFEMIGAHCAIPRASIVQEYGMTELSSQAYEDPSEGIPGRYHAPPWMLVDAVDPDTLAVLPSGARGILRIIDLANIGSCIAIQTADVGVTHADGGFEVHGRAPGSTPRGCARAMDALLSGSG